MVLRSAAASADARSMSSARRPRTVLRSASFAADVSRVGFIGYFKRTRCFAESSWTMRSRTQLLDEAMELGLGLDLAAWPRSSGTSTDGSRASRIALEQARRAVGQRLSAPRPRAGPRAALRAPRAAAAMAFSSVFAVQRHRGGAGAPGGAGSASSRSRKPSRRLMRSIAVSTSIAWRFRRAHRAGPRGLCRYSAREETASTPVSLEAPTRPPTGATTVRCAVNGERRVARASSDRTDRFEPRPLRTSRGRSPAALDRSTPAGPRP